MRSHHHQLHQQNQQQPKYSSKLEKISQTSSPSKQQQSPIQTASIKSRINPASLTTSYLKFKRFQQKKDKPLAQFNLESSLNSSENINIQHHQKQQHKQQLNKQTSTKQIIQSRTETIQEKSEQISSLQEMIIKRKMELNLLQESYENRQNAIHQFNSHSQYQQNDYGKMNRQQFGTLFEKTLQYTCRTSEGRLQYLQMVFDYQRVRQQQQRQQKQNKSLQVQGQSLLLNHILRWTLQSTRGLFMKLTSGLSQYFTQKISLNSNNNSNNCSIKQLQTENQKQE